MAQEQTQYIETGLPQVTDAELAQMEKTLALLKQVKRPPDAAAGAAAEPVTAAVTPRRRRGQTEKKELTMNAIPTASGLTSSKANVPTLDSVLDKVKTIGETQGRAADGLTHLLMATADAAYLGAIDCQDNKHGPGIHDNTRICEAYVKARTGATTFDTRPIRSRVFLSKIKTMIRLGMYAKGGPGEPISTLNAFVSLHQKMRKDPTKVGELVDLPVALIKFAREQIKRDQMLQEHEYRSFLVERPKDQRTVEEWWDAMRKQAQKLKAGMIKNIVGSDTSDEIDRVINAANKRLKDFAKAKGVQPADARSAALQAPAPQAEVSATA